MEFIVKFEGNKFFVQAETVEESIEMVLNAMYTPDTLPLVYEISSKLNTEIPKGIQ